MQAGLRLRVEDIASLPSGSINDDRIGHAGDAAWVIDGATDLVDVPLVGARSDAAWLAETIDQWLCRNATALPDNIVDLVPALSAHAAHEFDRTCRRKPKDRFEFPSASGLIIRVTDGGLDYISIGDCTLLIETAHQTVERHGVSSEDAGDVWISNRLEQLVDSHDPRNTGGIRSLLIPDLRKARERMNCQPGYGVFSITAPPPDYITSGHLSLTKPTRLLLASDGFMRLCDVYGVMSLPYLHESTFARGTSEMLAELRDIERDDADCQRFLRAKVSDDASVLIATVT